MDEEIRGCRLALATVSGFSATRLMTIQDPREALIQYFIQQRSMTEKQAIQQTKALIHRSCQRLAWLNKKRATIIFSGEDTYPTHLERLKRAPAALYFWGTLPGQKMVALVGSRGTSFTKMEQARKLATSLAEAKIGIISGGAIGIDTAAHQGALAAGSYTMAVLGSGLDRLYPERNSVLFAELALHGAVLTPFALGTPPRGYHFLLRNGMIAAWACAVVVVDAQYRSGALNTAHWARVLGIPLIAMKGSPGTTKLLQQGAWPASSAQDVLEIMAHGNREAHVMLPLEDEQQSVLSMIRHEAATVSSIARRLNWRYSRAAAVLLQLEIMGQVKAIPGGYYQLDRSVQ